MIAPRARTLCGNASPVIRRRHRHSRHCRRVLAIAPVINIREASERASGVRARETRLTSSILPGRANSFLHLHSVLAVNHFSARLTSRHDGEKVEFD